uniref:Interferon epsilon n=1 Tax=Equus caballus TaxID=9796 RepID=F6Z7A7_HORSE
MINKQFFEIMLVLLASSTIFSLELKLVLFQQRRVNRESLKLLNRLQPSAIQQCLSHRRNFLLPQKSVNPHQYQKRHALAILHEMLQQIFNLFRANIPLDAWEESHMETFLIELHQQLEYLEALMGLEAEQKCGPLGSENLRLQVKMKAEHTRNGPLNHVEQEPTAGVKTIGRGEQGFKGEVTCSEQHSKQAIEPASARATIPSQVCLTRSLHRCSRRHKPEQHCATLPRNNNVYSSQMDHLEKLHLGVKLKASIFL